MSSPGLPTIDRRTFLGGSLLAVLAVPFAGEAQQAGKVWRIGVLLPLGNTPPILERFLGGMRDVGWVENQGFVAEPRYAEGRLERLPELAAELVRLKVDLLVTMGTPATVAGKQATVTIPIVFGLVGDAVGAGVVPNLARPGGNVTGLSLYGPEVFGKGLELLKQAVPRAERVMITRPPLDNPSQTLADATADTTAKALGIRLLRIDVRHVADYEAAFRVAVRERVGAVLISPYLPFPNEIAAFALRNGLPTMTLMGSTEQSGQLIAYGANFGEQVRRVASYVDKILKGAKPGELPVEQPTKFELVINLITAKALGLTIPQPVLLRADQVIE
jgi:putative tryptophan/tyrosine transport system substrate-binding protein